MNSKLEYSEKIYNFEFDRKERLDSSVQFLVNIIAIIMAGSFYLVGVFELSSKTISVVFYLSTIFVYVFCAISIYFIIFGMMASGFIYMNDPTQLEAYQGELREYFGENAEEEYEKFLIKRYESIATINGSRNDAKSGRFFKAKIALTFAIVLFMFSASLHLVAVINWDVFRD